MKKRIAQLIYHLPIIRGILRRIEKLEKKEKAHIDKILVLEKDKKTLTKKTVMLEENINALTMKLAELEGTNIGAKAERVELLRKVTQLQQDMRQIRGTISDNRNELLHKIQYSYDKGLLPEQYEANLREWYAIQTGETLNLENPENFNQKIQWLKLNDNTLEKTRLADKFLVRDYVKERIGEQYLVPLIGEWDKFDDIDFEKLPLQFVLKTNHGCGYNIIVKDKNQLDYEDSRQKINKWMAMNFAFRFGYELQYKDIQPRIIVEEYLENNDSGLDDYKVFCFNGKAIYIMYLTDRQNGLKMAFYDREWNHMPFIYNATRIEYPVDKPDNLVELIELAERMSEGLIHVRVDFYRLNEGTLKFGEMTFTSASGICKWDPPEYNKIMGDLIELPKY